VSQPTTLGRIGLVVHPRRPLTNALDTVHRWAAANGVAVVQIRIDGQDRVVADPGDPATCDVILALGGDGTTLAALHAAAPHGVPVLGVACGSLGALTATTADQLDTALEAFAAGRWEAKRLPGVAISADGSEQHVALNDLVVIRKGASQVLIGIRVDGDLYVRFAGDGLIIATPLGSSAYTLAASGPVLAPHSDALVLTPLAPHGGCSPPLVVGTASAVSVEIEAGFAGARIEFDGKIKDMSPRRLDVGWRPEHATLARFAGAEPMFAGLRRRRILMDSPRVLARDDRAVDATGA
jgi:NAD+ kinase